MNDFEAQAALVIANIPTMDGLADAIAFSEQLTEKMIVAGREKYGAASWDAELLLARNKVKAASN